MSALTEKVAREHVRRDSYAGDGYTEPRESWTSCSCGAHIWAWQQFYAETDEDPDENWTQHIAYVTEAATREAVADDIKERLSDAHHIDGAWILDMIESIKGEQ